MMPGEFLSLPGFRHRPCSERLLVPHIEATIRDSWIRTDHGGQQRHLRLWPVTVRSSGRNDGFSVLAHDQDIQVGIQVTIDLHVDAAALVVDYCLKFQAGSVPCSYLPARAITWGQIKSLYR